MQRDGKDQTWLQSGTKSELRAAYQRYRAELTACKRERVSAQICDQLFHYLLKQREVEKVHLFLPLKKAHEIDLTPLMSQLILAGKSVILPRVSGKGLQHARYSKTLRLEQNRWGIVEPAADSPFLTQEEVFTIDAIITPLFISDFRGHRVGFGGGYYDRFFKEAPSAERIGVNYFPPISTAIADLHEADIPLDLLMTGENIYPVTST